MDEQTIVCYCNCNIIYRFIIIWIMQGTFETDDQLRKIILILIVHVVRESVLLPNAETWTLKRANEDRLTD